jgi:hypothetical protein
VDDVEGHLAQRHEATGARRRFDFEGLRAVDVQLKKPADDEQVGREPDRPAPDGWWSEYAGDGSGNPARAPRSADISR